MMRAKGIQSHPRVGEVEFAEDGDVSSKYFVHLKAGWWWPMPYGATCRGFRTVADFKDAAQYIERAP
jgi:hypothetical protein